MQERSGEPATILVTRDDDASVTETIDASGGRISVDRGDLTITLRIPEGAVADPVDITLTPVVDAESAVIDDWVAGVEFAPFGLLLAQPVALVLEGPGILPGLTFVEWGEGGGEVSPDRDTLGDRRDSQDLRPPLLRRRRG